MNGLSLLVALTALGITVEWERTPSGGEAYTIRVEPVVVETLRKDSAIESVVAIRDRNIRSFRVVVGPKNLQAERRTASTADEIQYGWSPNDTGGIDYYVQITPERLETLAQGIPLECTVHPDVRQIDKIYVFVGTQQLPRDLPKGTSIASTSPPRDINTVSRGSGVAPASNNETTGTSARYGDTGYGGQGTPQVSVSDTANRQNGYGNSTNTATGNQPYGPAPAGSTGGYGQYTDNTIPVPQLGGSQTPGYGTAGQTGYGNNRDPYGPRQETARPNGYSDPNYANSGYGQQGYGQPGYGQQQQPGYPSNVPYVAGVPNQPVYSTTPTVPVSTQTQSPGSDAVLQKLLTTIEEQKEELKRQQTDREAQNKLDEARRLSAVSVAGSDESQKSASKPFILTTLALFASIGANAYLGWLAWSFFWRFRDAASDLSRARSSSFPVGGAVGH